MERDNLDDPKRKLTSDIKVGMAEKLYRSIADRIFRALWAYEERKAPSPSKIYERVIENTLEKNKRFAKQWELEDY